MRCRHTRASYVGDTYVRLDSRGERVEPIDALTVYRCCDCGIEVLVPVDRQKRAIKVR